MHLDVQGFNLEGNQVGCRLRSVPDVCPQCHQGILPKLVASIVLVERNQSQAIFRCPRQSCQEAFIATYVSLGRAPSGWQEHELRHLAPIAPKLAVFPDTIKAISPMFTNIFNQSLEAEIKQLDQLVGIGLRKALEFLVKDYSAAEHPDKEQEIRNAKLGNCIEKYISDVNVKECAKRAAWLGNDETHYIRKWETKDINDLKLLVRLTTNWIDNHLLTKKYISDMESGKV